MDEITAEFTTEKVQKEAEVLETPVPEQIKASSSWIPIMVGLMTLIGMAVLSYVFWSRGIRAL